MLRSRKSLCIFLMALLLAQPVAAETVLPTEAEPDIVTAVCTVEDFGAAAASRQLPELTAAPLYALSEGTWTPVLAAALPEDVTADFSGTYGIPEDARRGYAFRIPLQEHACREDGTPITAEEFLFAIRQSFQEGTGWQFLAGAEQIRDGKLKEGSHIVSLQELGFSDVSAAWAAGYRDFYVDLDGFWGLSSGWRSVSDHTRFRDYAMPGALNEAFVSAAYLYRNYLMDGMESSYYQSEFVGTCQKSGAAYTPEDLGVLTEQPHAFILILRAPSTASSVAKELCSLYLPGNSYGPYRVSAVSETELTLEPNPHWWGEADMRGYDRILCRKIGS